MPKTLAAEANDFRWEARTARRVWWSSTLAGGAIGILFACLQVQGWTVPKPLALALFSVLGLVIVGAVAAASYEIIRALRRFLEHRATTASWVLAEAPGFLDFEPDGKRAMDRLTREMNKLAEDTKDLGEKVDGHRRRMERAAHRSGRHKQRLANRTAKDIDQSAAYIEKRVALLKALVRDIYRNFQGLIEMANPTTEDDVRVVAELRSVLNDTRAVTAESMGSTEGYRDTVRDLEKLNSARTVRVASRRLADALGEVVTVLRQYEKRSGALVTDLDRKVSAL